MFKQTIIELIVLAYQHFFRIKHDIPFLPDKGRGPLSQVNAHIFGSGATAIETRVLLNEQSITLGCNLTLALLPHWHYGFVERLEDNAFGIMQMDVLRSRTFDNLVLKNTYPLKKNKISSNIQILKKEHGVSLLKECQVVSNRDDVDHILSSLLSTKYGLTRQYASSVLTMILYAVRLGVRDIILHGVDFGGPCFYDLEPYTQYQPKSNQSPILGSHQTDDYVITFSEILDKVTELLANDGVKVRHAKDIL